MSDNKINILIAFPYFSEQIREFMKSANPNEYDLIIDSGAFSAHNSGHSIKLEDYCKFLDSISFLKKNSVQLDVVFNPEKSHENFIKMREMGYDVCPVFTRGDSEKYLESLLNNNEYIFVGGVQRGEGSKEFAKWILERTKGKKIHYLAFVRPDYLNYYKPYSTDSSSWSMVGRYGNLQYFYKGRLRNITRKDFINKPPVEFIKSMDTVGIPYEKWSKLRFSESWKVTTFDKEFEGSSVNTALQISTAGHIYYSMKAEKEIGTKIYLALANVQDLRLMWKLKKEILKNAKL